MEYAISDIHGKRRLFEKMLNFIRFSSSDKLYVIGDCLDRGEESVELLEMIMNTPNIELLLGNHEELCLSAYGAGKKTGKVDGFAKQLWSKCGGEQTIEMLDSISLERRVNLLDYLQKTPLYKILDRFLLTHAGLDLTIRKTDDESLLDVLERQDLGNILWLRDEFYDHKAFEEKRIVFGHTPTWQLFKRFEQEIPEISFLWFDPRFNDKIGIDCGACFPEHGGRLGCLRLDDMREFYVA